MAPSIRNLRRLVVTGGVALLAVLAIFLGVARLKGRHFGFDLPGRLGVDISQTASGFTYSQSQKGHTLFTIHASKLVQYKGDQAELHDVTITLYGAEGSGRGDTIHGSDFTYDRKQGIARATGAVQIDFASPDGGADRKSGSAVPRPPDPASGKSPVQQNSSTIHVTTSGVVFDQKSGKASTDQRVDFVLPRASGSAIGADYDAHDGVLILGREVALTASGEGGSASDTTIHAEHAQLLRDTHQAYLIKAYATSAGKHSTSDQATVTFRPDGSARQIDARGHVHVVTEDGAEVHASDAVVDLDAQSHPLVANLNGGVTYYANQSERTMQGSAVSGTVAFVAAVRPAPGPDGAVAAAARQQVHHAQFRGAVTFVLQQHLLSGDPNGSATREIRAGKLDIDFAPGADGRSEAQRVLGAGGAMVNLHDIPVKGPAKSTAISGEQLLATLANGREFKVLDGNGHTRIVDSSMNGATSTSSGNTLHVTFAGSSAAGATTQVDTAVQAGGVALEQTPAPDAKNADGSPQTPFHATAQRAEYRAADQVLYLTGDPHLHSDSLALSADKVDYHRETGDAAAAGNVKATYVAQPGSGAPGLGGDGPVHVTADHAQLARSTNVSVFYGAGGGASALPARMWQGGDSVTAPVLELARDGQTLDAHGARGERGPVVHATLGSKASTDRATSTSRPAVGSVPAAGSTPAAGNAPAAGSTANRSGAPTAAPTRITCEALHYSDKDRRADLGGLVTAEQASGTVHADQAQVFLSPAAPNKASQLDRTVATGHVVITQPGRRGTGDKLVYTAADGCYVLTGSPGRPPRMSDAEKGTTTGAALIFRGADDSVEVSSHLDNSPGHGSSGGNLAPGSAGPGAPPRTVTDTHTPK